MYSITCYSKNFLLEINVLLENQFSELLRLMTMQICTQQGSEWKLKFRHDKVHPFGYVALRLVLIIFVHRFSEVVYKEVEIIEMFLIDGEYSDILSRSAAAEGLNPNVLTCTLIF